MASKTLSRNATVAPDFVKYRTVADAVDSLPETEKKHGINMGHYRRAIIDVKAEAGANPSVSVLWWSEETQAFVQEHTPLDRAGVGNDVGYQFVVEANGRIMFVAVTAGVGASNIATISVAGYDLDHTL